jgi:hypothetical protein
MEEINVSVGILASIILGLVLDQKMPDYVYLVRSRTCSSIIFFYSDTELSGCLTVWRPGIFMHIHIFVHMHMHMHRLIPLCTRIHKRIYMYK